MPKTKSLLETIFPRRQMQFAPVEVDDDEISKSIESDPIVRDDQWELKENLDGESLANFWDQALNELAKEEKTKDKKSRTKT